jgi:hypothetical protein
MSSSPQQEIYKPHATSKAVPKNVWGATLLVVCRPSPPDHVIPTEKSTGFTEFIDKAISQKARLLGCVCKIIVFVVAPHS